MTIIYLTKQHLIAPESAFAWQSGGTIMDALVLPRPAGDVLDIGTGRAIKAIYHATSQAYAFVWHGKSYRVLMDIPGAPVPLVLSGIEHHDHWHACKLCRDGAWCEAGMRIIFAEMEGQGVL